MNTSAQPPFISFTKSLVTGAESSDQKLYEIDCELVSNEQDLMDEFAKTFSFPDYFGHNWSGWWDCMTDLREEYQSNMVVSLKNFNALMGKLSKKEINRFLVLIRDVSVFWAIPIEGDDRYANHSSIKIKYILNCNNISIGLNAVDENLIGSFYFEVVS